MACLGMESAMLHIWMAWSPNQSGGSRKCGSVQFASCFGKHDTLHQIVDDETGEKVLVWGVDGSELPVVSRRDLRWNPTKVAIPGDIAEDRLYRSSSYSIPRAVQTHKSGSKWVGTEAENWVGTQKSTKYCGPEQEIVAAKKKWSEHVDRQNYEYSLLDTFFSIKSFKTVGAEEQIIQALASLQIYRPSHIQISLNCFQALAFQPVAKGSSCIIADQTGSGKSLAYLAPLIQRMKHDEVSGASISLPRRPRVLILVPTGELAVQILNVCKGFSKSGCPFKSMVATGSFRWRTQVDNLDNGPDILIATPGRFLHLVNEEKLLLDNLKSAVFDEVDILFEDQDFNEVMDKLDKSPASLTIQYLHVTATLPVEIHDSLLKRYPDAMPLIGPNLHRTAAGLQEVLVDCSGDNEVSTETAFLNKKAALLQLVERRSVPKTIIFCNKIETCRRVENILNRFDRSKSKIYAYPYHAAVKQECRLKNLQDFLHSATTKPSFLVCTDRASRGLDPIDVEHVILFDFPRDPSEYVRRVGRTARAGRDGKVYVFAVGKQVGLARRIMTRNEKGHPIHSVPLDA